MAKLLIVIAVILIFYCQNFIEAQNLTTCECLSVDNSGSSSSSEETKERFQICFSDKNPFGQVYDRRKKACYTLLEKGPCEKDQLLARNPKSFNSVICLPICEMDGENATDWKSKFRDGECAVHHQDMSEALLYE